MESSHESDAAEPSSASLTVMSVEESARSTVPEPRVLRRARLSLPRANRLPALNRTRSTAISAASSRLLECCITIGGVALTFLARWELNPLLGTNQPFTVFFVTVLLSAWLGGLLPAMVAVLLGTLGGMYFAPDRSLLAPLMFCTVSSLTIAFAEAHRRALRRAQDANEEIQLHREELEREIAERRTVERSLRAVE